MKSSDIVRAMRLAVKAKRPVMLWGPPGVGKSQLVRFLAQQLGYKLIDVRATLLDPVDLRGVPSIEGGRTKWNPPCFLPDGTDGAKGYILFLDELPSAPPSVQAALYQLILDRKLGEYELPDNCYVCCAGNREGDRAVSFKMGTAMANRLLHLEFTVALDPWIDWAIDNEVRVEVISYHRLTGGKCLHDFDPKKNDKAFPTPRTWEFVSDELKGLDEEALTDPSIREILYDTLEGTIGKAHATQFYAFLDVWMNLPNPDMVLMDPDNADIPTNPAVKFALCGALAKKATLANADRFYRYANRLPAEFAAIMITEAARREPKLQNTRGFIEWSTKHHKKMN